MSVPRGSGKEENPYTYYGSNDAGDAFALFIPSRLTRTRSIDRNTDRVICKLPVAIAWASYYWIISPVPATRSVVFVVERSSHPLR